VLGRLLLAGPIVARLGVHRSSVPTRLTACVVLLGLPDRTLGRRAGPDGVEVVPLNRRLSRVERTVALGLLRRAGVLHRLPSRPQLRRLLPTAAGMLALIGERTLKFPFRPFNGHVYFPPKGRFRSRPGPGRPRSRPAASPG